ncbi:MAG: hypothetical protein DRP09_21970 [Candidatus Thorarchaeota archaeon]|nr:MAG: hypothetical protein DRP09_21970 [Candidatus Thorarchaeota archaeon]
MDYVEEYLNHLAVERGLSRNSVEAYSHDLRRFFSWLGIRSPKTVVLDDLRAYMGWLREKGLCARSVARSMSAVRGYFRYLLDRQPIRHPFPPADGLPRDATDPQRPQHLLRCIRPRRLTIPARNKPLSFRLCHRHTSFSEL